MRRPHNGAQKERHKKSERITLEAAQSHVQGRNQSTVPGPQGTQAFCPTEGWALPLGQTEQKELPAWFWNWPCAQLVHEGCFTAMLNLPARARSGGKQTPPRNQTRTGNGE
jgi:hypothetical protein